ncbi:T9SS type A sorting domain-containing protein [Algibacter lectus]|uniref:T9SS type A sorting domain-containing protein n=1 Tax=Algibacter lectus TaxID=221126 RepID=UPI0026E9645A|nr:T9SS type A sorting domain-containing protein [Algibacter lectus]MDO7136930.1 T9SS type A sorting domain-containing protein [Algibacter lectus]
MKTKLLLLCTLFSLYTHAQLRLIKQTENNVYRRGVTGLKTLNNDILFTMTESGSPYKLGAYVSNGSNKTTNQIQGLENNRYSFEGLDKENYAIDNDVFLFSSRLNNSQSEDKAYRINDGRTSATLVTSSTSAESITRTSNNKIIKQRKEYYPPYTLFGNRYAGGYNFFISIFNSDGILENSYEFDGNTGTGNSVDDFNSLTLITNIFYWKGTYYFIGNNTQNRTDLYKFDGLSNYRMTKLYVNGNSNTSVGPSDILLEDSYIYFQGLYRTWGVTDGPNDFIDEGRELCYTNGDIMFGASQTQIPLFIFNVSKENYDGTRGYRAKNTSESSAMSKPIKEFNGSIIYIDENNDNLNIINPDGTNYNLVNSTKDTDSYFTFNNKFYYLTRKLNPDYSSTCYMYEIDGDPLNTIRHEFPLSIDGNNFSFAQNNYLSISENEGKAYIIGGYYPSSGVKAAILSFDFSTSQFTKEKVFNPNEISGYITNINRFNNGFVFSDFDKVYSYNVEIRAKYFTPNQGGKSADIEKNNSEEDITYNNTVYNVNLETTSLAPNETLKIELLDTTSIAFKSKIGNLPNNSYAKTYYKLVTLNESSHQSTVNLTYNNADFTDNITDPSNLTAQIYKDGNWVDIEISSVNAAEKTFTITHNFEPNTLVFLKNNATLSSKSFKNENLSVYPNPTTSQLHIKLKNGATIKKTTIYSLVGQEVLKNKTDAPTVNLSNLAEGIYILKVESSHGTFSKRILKK